MTLERRGLISFDGEDQTIVGPDIVPGQTAPDFVAIALDWTERNPLGSRASISSAENARSRSPQALSVSACGI